MNFGDLKKIVSAQPEGAADDKCELIEGAMLEAAGGGRFPWGKWGMAFLTDPGNISETN